MVVGNKEVIEDFISMTTVTDKIMHVTSLREVRKTRMDIDYDKQLYY